MQQRGRNALSTLEKRGGKINERKSWFFEKITRFTDPWQT
jgi:hypothetical protein